ncbi:recombinase family protein [Sporosarcina pasteurii]|uniref:Resolvase, N terminal domain n=1 Tax=Sporosarcina pasteurii TaxID=1474 RepID=A0A380BNF4_SPOPA|nr:recombinase family protein [Sporosarcina pasteurii]MDS9470911.1 recombinase family protein [Sporosarcina pasteurii]QBQ05430.1 recombinase family protein [Sporosarcina pasteurii]SUJ03261.1 Resolvase, N terminal domain [Sporosarcina pasteurii]
MKNLQSDAAIYCRTNSLENMKQLQNLVAYAKVNGLNPIILTDLASGVGYRPSLNLLLKLIRSKEINTIIIRSYTRLSRDKNELTAILDEFKKYNVKIISTEMPNEVVHQNIRQTIQWTLSN